MGQLYSKLNQLVLNDVETAADPDRPREKLETAFTTPARPFLARLPDPRSATQYIDRTPIYAPVTNGGTPKVPKTIARPRFLETDLDEVLPDSQKDLDKVLPDSQLDADKVLPESQKDLDKVLPDSQKDLVNILPESQLDLDKVLPDSQVDVDNVLPDSQLVLDETVPESRLDLGTVSTATELHMTTTVQHPGEVVEIILEEGNDSLEANWSGIGGPDRSVGTEAEFLTQNFMSRSLTEISTIVQDWILDHQFQIGDGNNQSILGDSYSSLDAKTELPAQNSTDVSQISASAGDPSTATPTSSFSAEQSDSLVVHNSESFTQHSGDFEWEEADSLLVFSPSIKPDAENAVKNIYNTPKKSVLTNKPSGRTPLGDVSTNSPVIQSSTPKQPKALTAIDNKLWKNVRDERLKRGMDAENTPPHVAFNSYPPEVVQSAPGKMRTKSNKTKWSNDSLLI